MSVNVRPMSDDTAIVSTVFNRIKNTGDLLFKLFQGAATYTLLRQDGDVMEDLHVDARARAGAGAG